MIHKVWIHKNVTTGYVIDETTIDHDTETDQSVSITTPHRFKNMWDAINFFRS